MKGSKKLNEAILKGLTPPKEQPATKQASEPVDKQSKKSNE